MICPAVLLLLQAARTEWVVGMRIGCVVVMFIGMAMSMVVIVRMAMSMFIIVGVRHMVVTVGGRAERGNCRTRSDPFHVMVVTAVRGTDLVLEAEHL
jgi:hypothetical protein